MSPVSDGMKQPPDAPRATEPDLIVEPMAPRAVGGRVRVVDPPPAEMVLTADAAEISALRMLQAADKARGQR